MEGGRGTVGGCYLSDRRERLRPVLLPRWVGGPGGLPQISPVDLAGVQDVQSTGQGVASPVRHAWNNMRFPHRAGDAVHGPPPSSKHRNASREWAQDPWRRGLAGNTNSKAVSWDLLHQKLAGAWGHAEV